MTLSGQGLSNSASALPGSLSAKRIDMPSMTRKVGFATFSFKRWLCWDVVMTCSPLLCWQSLSWTCSCPRSLVVSRLVAGCLSRHPDSNQHLVSNQSAERTDQRPVPAKPPSSHRVTAQDARFSPQFGAAVRMATNRKVPCRLGHAWRSSFDEALWACRTELAAGAPETPYRPEHELAAGLFVEQGKAVGKQVLEGEMLPSHLFQEAAPRLLWRADECWQRAQRIECSCKPPVVEVRTPHTRVHMFRRRSDADRMTSPHIEFRQEIIQEHETIRHKRRSNAIDVVVDPAQGLPRILSMPSELTGAGGAGAVVAHRARRRSDQWDRSPSEILVWPARAASHPT